MIQLLHNILSFLILLSYFISQNVHILHYEVFAVNVQEPMGYTKHMSELVSHAPYYTDAVQALQLAMQCNNCLRYLV